MANDIFNRIELADVPKMDFSYTTNLVSGIQAQIEGTNKRAQQMGEEAYNNRQRM